MTTIPPQMYQSGTLPATANSPVAPPKSARWFIENIQLNLDGALKHLKSNPNHPCRVMLFAFRDLEALFPHTTVDTIRSTGIRSTLAHILAIRNLPGDGDYQLKLRASNLLNKYEAMILRSDPGVDKILRSDVDQMEQENKGNGKEVPARYNVEEGLTDKQRADMAAFYDRKVPARTSSLAGTWAERNEVLKSKHEAEVNKKGSDPQGCAKAQPTVSQPQGYAKVEPMVIGAVTKQTAAEPLAVKTAATGKVASTVQPVQPVQHAHHQDGYDQLVHAYHQPFQPAHRQHAYPRPAHPRPAHPQPFQPARPAQFSNISFTMPPPTCHHNSASTEDGKNQTLRRCQTTVARWKIEDLKITPTTAAPAITSLATTTTSDVLEDVSSDSDDADQELEKKQDEHEIEYEIVNIEKEDGDDWIVVGDDAF